MELLNSIDEEVSRPSPPSLVSAWVRCAENGNGGVSRFAAERRPPRAAHWRGDRRCDPLRAGMAHPLRQGARLEARGSRQGQKRRAHRTSSPRASNMHAFPSSVAQIIACRCKLSFRSRRAAIAGTGVAIARALPCRFAGPWRARLDGFIKRRNPGIADKDVNDIVVGIANRSVLSLHHVLMVPVAATVVLDPTMWARPFDASTYVSRAVMIIATGHFAFDAWCCLVSACQPILRLATLDRRYQTPPHLTPPLDVTRLLASTHTSQTLLTSHPSHLTHLAPQVAISLTLPHRGTLSTKAPFSPSTACRPSSSSPDAPCLGGHGTYGRRASCCGSCPLRLCTCGTCCW